VTPLAILAVTAIAQVAFLAALLVFLVDRRRRTRVRSELVAERRAQAQQHLRAWVAGGKPIEPFVASLAWMPSDAALEFASELIGTSLDARLADVLADALRREPWMRRLVGQHNSRFWWKRREAARAFAIVGTPDDRERIRALLDDRTIAVAIIAIGAIPRVANEEMIAWTLDRYPALSSVARRFLNKAYAQARDVVERALIMHLRDDAPPNALRRWVAIAADLQLTGALDRIASLDSHPDALVRSAVARALAKRPHPDSMAALRALIGDATPEVRADAAWAMGQINNVGVLPHLKRAVHDPSWQVRYQSALALATMGEKGRSILGDLTGDPDRYVADMAVMISGLSDGALLGLVAE
jgi:HEAT repeat protein